MYRNGVKSSKISKLSTSARKAFRLFWGPIVALIFLVSPLGVLAKDGVDNPPANATAYYSVSVGSKSFSESTLTITGSMVVNNFVGREDEQYAKFTWGDGAVESIRLMNIPGYSKSSSTLRVSNFTKSHTYTTESSWLVNVKVYRGDRKGTELNTSYMGQYFFETENTRATCGDRSDNDKDGPKDLYDNDCQKFRQTENTAALCSDNIDNDINGKTDLYDPNCVAFIPKEDNAEACSDGLDNDLDNKVDLYDPNCSAFAPPENTAALCTDRFDNDFDGKTDLLDSDCAAFVPTEDNPTACTDGLDNDLDGLADGQDADCVGQTPLENTAGTCLDAIDNDFDGMFDWDDSDCAAFVQPSNCPVGFAEFFIPGFGFICGANGGY